MSGESGRSRILVVEPEADIREFIREVLGDEGYRVEGARDGAEAAAMVLSFRPHLVLLDPFTPSAHVNGVLDQVRRLCHRCRVVLVSNVHNLPRTAGVVATLFKPFHFGEILDVCRRALAAA